jgi:hypothetical protein
MSLLLVYHDRARAVVACDDRATYFDAEGSRQTLAGRIPKFATIGGLVLGSVGRCDLALQLERGTSRLLASEAGHRFLSLAHSLPHICRRLFAARRPLDIPAADDKIDVMLLGYDQQQARIRCFVWRSEDNFEPIETTDLAGSNRIVALGAFDISDEVALIDLTQRAAKPKGTPWIASQLRDAVNDISAKWPATIGPASFFAALDARGSVTLPKEFATPPVTDVLPEAATTSLNAGRFYVGSIWTPKAGAPDTVGNNDGGSGAQNGMINGLNMSIVQTTGSQLSTTGNGVVTNPENAIDGDLTTRCQLTASAGGGGGTASLYLSGPPGMSPHAYQSAVLKLRCRCLTNNVLSNGDGVCQAYYSVTGTNPGAWMAIIAATSSPSTLAETTFQVPLPGGQNLSQVAVYCFALVVSGGTSGSIVFEITEAWIEVVQ